jgi:sterol desaturase/sphingolipid hydroxylase (fatty acid hydroxylase superfamily)
MEHLGRNPLFGLTMLVFVLGEVIWRTRIAQRGYNGKAALVSISVGLGNLLSGAVFAVVIGVLFSAATKLAPFHWSLSNWRVWLVAFVLEEFVYYWAHRLSHTVRWLWATHAVHHSPEEMTFLSAIRLGWTNLFSGGWLLYLPLVLLGFDPRLIFALLALNLHYQFFLHTEAIGRLGPLEWLLNTPAHHRVHHAANRVYLDCNYGGVLIVFDRLFGSFVAERSDEPIRYGLVHPVRSNNPLVIALGEWKRLFADMLSASSLRGALRIAMGRP